MHLWQFRPVLHNNLTMEPDSLLELDKVEKNAFSFYWRMAENRKKERKCLQNLRNKLICRCFMHYFWRFAGSCCANGCFRGPFAQHFTPTSQLDSAVL